LLAAQELAAVFSEDGTPKFEVTILVN